MANKTPTSGNSKGSSPTHYNPITRKTKPVTRLALTGAKKPKKA